MVRLAYLLPLMLLSPLGAASVHHDPCGQLDRLTNYNRSVQFDPLKTHNSKVPAIRCMFKTSLRSVAFVQQRQQYFGINAKLINIDLKINLGRAKELFRKVPQGFTNQVFLWQRDLVKAYNSTIRTLDAINPLPGYSFFGRARSPAFPFILLSTIDENQFLLDTYPFLDDEHVKNDSYAKNSYGLGITMTLF